MLNTLLTITLIVSFQVGKPTQCAALMTSLMPSDPSISFNSLTLLSVTVVLHIYNSYHFHSTPAFNMIVFNKPSFTVTKHCPSHPCSTHSTLHVQENPLIVSTGLNSFHPILNFPAELASTPFPAPIIYFSNRIGQWPPGTPFQYQYFSSLTPSFGFHCAHCK